MRLTRRLRPLILLSTLSLGLAACGGGEATSTPQKAPAGADCDAPADCASGFCIGRTCRTQDEVDDQTSNNDTANNGQNNAPDNNGSNNDAANNGSNNAASNNDVGNNGSNNDASNNASNNGANNASNNASNNATNNASPDPVDCAPIADGAEWDLCEAGPDSCGAVFTDGSGCEALCEAAGLVCGATYENIDGSCRADMNRPALSCGAPSGHNSDFCLCVRADCAPRCEAGACGPDGCGGTCGDCGEGLTCVGGQCEERDVSPDEDCSSYPFSADTLLAERVGFGRRASGGDPDNVYRVDSLSNDGDGTLRRALESGEDYWIVFDVEGTITLDPDDPIQIQSNKTVDGRGRDVTVKGPMEVRDGRNIIISDLKMENDLEGHCTQDGDVFSVRGVGTDDPAGFTSRDIWVHHSEIYNGGDGLFDLRGASRVTLSWSHFHTHKKGLLMSDDTNDDPTPGMHVTMHHNFFDRISLRGPQFKHGKAHYYNNYQFEWYEYGAGGLGGAQFYSENNVYQSREGAFCLPQCPDPNPCGDNDFDISKAALVHDWASNGAGSVKSVGDWRVQGDEVLDVNEPDQVFDPADFYSWTAETADDALRQRIRAQAGPRVDYCR